MLTSDQKVMGKRINPTWLKLVGWATAAVMAAATLALIFV